MRLPGGDLAAALGPALPGDHARQWQPERYAEARAGRTEERPWRVVDLGCGAGASLDVFRAADPAVAWTGLDVPGSVEAAERTRADGDIRTFDGARIPLADGEADLVFCKQVLEHVARPAPLLAEVARILRPGGIFAGSVSQLEPFHSRSTGNWTPYGLQVAVADAGLALDEVRPGIDALTLIARRFAGRARVFDRFWARESPANRLLGALAGGDARAANAAKLLLAGQFCFLCSRG
jgi:SAM-dependent methyltransferase